MDVARDPEVHRRKRARLIASIAIGVVLLVFVSTAIARLAPAAPTLDRASVLLDTVKRGELVREVRGVGTLVPEDTRWLPASTGGRVERILLRPGARVAADSVVLELSNPQVVEDANNARLAIQSAEAALESLRVQLENELLGQQASLAGVEAEFGQAQMEADANQRLLEEGLVSPLLHEQSQRRAMAWRTRFEIEEKRLAAARESIRSRLRVQQAAVDQARGVEQLQASRLASLSVRSASVGVLQQVPVEVGQTVSPGQNLARVADPTRLKAELRIPETRARDIELEQPVEIDTRNGKIPGRVSRKDPAAVNGTVTVDVTLVGAPPKGAVPDLSVDGVIQLERIENVLFIHRPAFGQEQSTITLFKVIDSSGHAERTQVRVGRSSVNAIEVASGLAPGDEVVISDMSAWDTVDRVRLR